MTDKEVATILQDNVVLMTMIDALIRDCKADDCTEEETMETITAFFTPMMNGLRVEAQRRKEVEEERKASELFD